MEAGTLCPTLTRVSLSGGSATLKWGPGTSLEYSGDIPGTFRAMVPPNISNVSGISPEYSGDIPGYRDVLGCSSGSAYSKLQNQFELSGSDIRRASRPNIPNAPLEYPPNIWRYSAEWF